MHLKRTSDPEQAKEWLENGGRLYQRSGKYWEVDVTGYRDVWVRKGSAPEPKPELSISEQAMALPPGSNPIRDLLDAREREREESEIFGWARERAFGDMLVEVKRRGDAGEDAREVLHELCRKGVDDGA